MIYILDASAIIAWLRNETGADVVEQAVRDSGAQSLVHAINLCEVFYDACRNAGEARAQSVVSDLAAAGVVERDDFDQAAAGQVRGARPEGAHIIGRGWRVKREDLEAYVKKL